MTVKEYPKEGRVEYVIPRCPKCGKMTRTVEFTAMTETVISLLTRCSRCDQIYRPDYEDLDIIHKYPLNKIFVVDSRGNKV